MSIYTKRLSKTISVDITVGADGTVCFDFEEPESGDASRITTSLENMAQEEVRVGSELLSWVSLVADELDKK